MTSQKLTFTTQEQTGLQALTGQLEPITRIVAHSYPDLDVWASLFILFKEVPHTQNAQLIFVPAGDTLEGSTDDPTVLHIDTGGGRFDHHDTAERTCAALKVAECLRVEKKPGYRNILAMTVDSDNDGERSPTDASRIIRAFTRLFRKDNEPDWPLIQEQVLLILEAIYLNELQSCKAQAEFARIRNNVAFLLPNGTKVAFLINKGNLIEEAAIQGAHVVAWVSLTPQGTIFSAGVKVTRNASWITLKELVAKLRETECQLRELNPPSKLDYVGLDTAVPGWYLHPSLRIVACGTLRHQLPEFERTKMQVHLFKNLVLDTLGTTQ